MCGIVGIFNFQRSSGPDPAVVERMRDAMLHRGPDGAGIWRSPGGHIVLGHRRLSIIDLDPSASQPMCNEDETVWVTFNGEIYNHAELRAELVAAGHRFRTDHSDTETLVHGYEQWGLHGLVQLLVGDYGIGLWDQRHHQLHLIRDRIGVKPVYFTVHDGSIAFASEIKALLQDPRVPRDLEPLAMYHYLTFLTTPAPLTMFRGIYKLPAGHILSVALGGEPKLARYWDAVPGRGIDAGALRGMPDEDRRKFYVDGIRARLRQAVDRRMMSDVPFGVFLSGGIDSSTNVALMSDLMDRPVDTFTVGFSDHTHLNELEPARSVARHFGTNHREVLVNEKDMIGYLDSLIHTQDEPIADWTCIPLHFVSELARKSGVTVVQVGEGSDEQFCGYASYLKYLRLHRYFWKPFRELLPDPMRTLVASVAHGMARAWPSLAVAADFIDRAARDRELFWSGAHVFKDLAKREIAPADRFLPTADLQRALQAGFVDPAFLLPDSLGVVRSYLGPFDLAHPDADQLARMTYSEMCLRLPELLLMRVDKICMGSTIEARVPFLDQELIEFTMNIPQRFKIGSGTAKQLLKQSVRGWIPDAIIERRKMGFDAPMSQWLHGEFGRRVEATMMSSRLLDLGLVDRIVVRQLCLQHRERSRDNGLSIWALFNLVAWFDYWIDGKSA